MSKLYVVGTPIGNLGDFSPRALEVLQNCDFIAAEDTRVTLKLLNRFGVKKPMVSYYEHNIRARGEEIVDRILAGESCAVVTDAGMPCISDPGEDLVRLCREREVEIEVVPGPSAVIAALAVSGLPTSRFSFEGFLSTTRKNRLAHLEEIRQMRHTLVFYEAPHKLLTTLQDLKEGLGDRRVALCRELTKLHEEVVRTTFSGALEHYADHSPKGEYVLVVEGYTPPQPVQVALEEAVALARRLVEEGQAPTAACKEAARQTGHRKSQIYTALQEGR
ncbi:16S rRNA (cytidine(1402)-2'-O)-methyltransferase [Bittarella massiliensis]|uniref:16S rRNA (cytidine(1402)-2'-O)-methyltransferase n=1 Tax=Bittarella massiliensis (ex Durand et al. 2017) TaxID=1720313 RepID=UPI00163BE738|nr:16S rRNA (cytidine(1402)-2'-O)-methyltransferase [Bittarella massiliensis (ex Durand et al. 2017)]